MNIKFVTKISGLLLSVILSTSCIKSYDVDVFVKPQVVLNSLLTADSLITIELWWSRNLKDTSSILNHANRVVGAKITLTEDDNTIAQITSTDTVLILNNRAKTGAKYNITVETPGEPLLTASTTVPLPPNATCTFIEKRGDFYHYRIENVQTHSDAPSLLLGYISWAVSNGGEYPFTTATSNGKIYAIAQYADKFNMERDNSYVETSGSIEIYKYLMRTESQNIDRVYPLNFSVYKYGYTDPAPGAPERKQTKINHTTTSYKKIELTAPSIDYDQYYTTTTRWRINREQNNILNPQVIKIHTNIKGGLGIFAACNKKSFLFEQIYEH